MPEPQVQRSFDNDLENTIENPELPEHAEQIVRELRRRYQRCLNVMIECKNRWDQQSKYATKRSEDRRFTVTYQLIDRTLQEFTDQKNPAD